MCAKVGRQSWSLCTPAIAAASACANTQTRPASRAAPMSSRRLQRDLDDRAGRPASGGALTPEETRRVLGAAQGRRQLRPMGHRARLRTAPVRGTGAALVRQRSRRGSADGQSALHRVTGHGIVFAEPKNRSGPVGASRSPTRWSTCSGPTARRSSPSGCGRVTGGRTATYQHVLPALGRDAADQMGRRCRTRWHTNWHAADHGRKVRAGHRGWS